MNFSTTNLVDSVIDEISLEGLDGITIEALEQRLSVKLKMNLPLNEKFMEQIWEICVEIPDLDFYKLEVPRDKLIIIDRCALMENDIDETESIDIYEYFPIEDVKMRIKGSCKSYYSRILVTGSVRKMSLFSAKEEYGQKLIIVASQELREESLIGGNNCPLLDLNVMQYCFLERIGRARHYGEVSQKKSGFCSIHEDPKLLFYHRKILLQNKLILKQFYHHISNNHTFSGSLLHLTRFYAERKPIVITIMDNIVTLLKSKENHIAEYDEVKQLIPIEKGFKKLFRVPFLPKVLQTDLRVPYRTLYPNATLKEYQQKNMAKERMIRVVQLMDPNFSIDSICPKEDEEKEDEEDETTLPNMSFQKYNVPFLKQAYRTVEDSQRNGLKQLDLGRKLGFTKLQARTILRNLIKTNSITTFMADVGRQRCTMFVSRKFEKTNELTQQFQEELEKMKELTKDLMSSKKKSRKKIIEEPVEDVPDAEDAESNMGFAEFECEDLGLEEKDVNETVAEPADKIRLDAACKILRKYKLTYHHRGYKRTFLNLVQRHKEQNVKQMDGDVQITQKQSELGHTTFFNDIEVSVAQKPLRLGKSLNEAVGFIEEFKKNGEQSTPSVTFRLLKRANMIISAVQKQKVISNLEEIRKEIGELESREGHDAKMDKKSLLRLLRKLVKDNFIKCVKLTMSYNNVSRTMTLICDPKIELDDPFLKSKIDKAKAEFCISSLTRFRQPANVASTSTLRTKNSSRYTKQLLQSNIHVKQDAKIGKKYGFSPKFIRMQNMHILMYYLIFEHPGEPQVSKELQLESLRAQGHQISDALAAEMSTIYCDEVDWKMFVPPFMTNSGWPQGWTLMSDIILRVPLSIFVKLVKIGYVLPDLEEYLNHPIRKHYLVKDIPSPLRDVLLIGRKYIYSIHETITRLCYIGLVQFGPQHLKEKDQVFVYLNRRSELLDTTSSAAGYHKIEKKAYPKTMYQFNSMQAVEKYWYDMWNICINTCLGGRLVVQGKDIVLEDLDKKTEMIMTLEARSPKNVHLTDTGITPGDRQGAAGLDSALFAHLKRNWNWGEQYYTSRNYKCLSTKEQDDDDEIIESLPATVTAKRPIMMERSSAKPPVLPRQQERDLLFIPQTQRQKSFVRKVMPTKTKKLRSRVKYDEVDHCALQRMDKLRVDWDPREDNVLLLCKVAMMYLCPNPRKQLVPYTAVRDVLHAYSKTCNKTSRACHRRLVYMMKQAKTVNSILLGIEEIKQNYQVNERYDGICEKVKVDCEDPNEYEAKVCKIFKELVFYIIEKYYNLSNMEVRETMELPNSVQEFHLQYQLKHAKKAIHAYGFTKDISEVNDIHAATVNSVIHSSMCCGKDRRSWAYELFKIYQQYPEFLLRNAMVKIRSDQMVSVKKNYMCAMKKYNNCLPMSSSQYQFSTNYVHKFQTKWPYDVFFEADVLLVKLIGWQHEHQLEDLNYAVPRSVEGIEATAMTGGVVAAIHDLIPRNMLEFDIQIPDQVIMLDPRLREKDEFYLRIAERYQALLMNVGNDCAIASVDDDAESFVELEHEEIDVSDVKVQDSALKLKKRAAEMRLPKKNVKRVRFEDQAGTSQGSNYEFCDVESLQVTKMLPERTFVDCGNHPVDKVLVVDVPVSEENSEPQARSESRKFSSINEVIESHKKKKLTIEHPRRLDNVTEKRHTRIAMLSMGNKEDWKDFTVADTHHAHEYFVVNSFKILFSLRLPASDRQRRLDEFRGLLVPSESIPLEEEISKRVITRIKEYATYPIVQISYEDFKEEMNDRLGIPWEYVDSIYNFIKDTKEFGASLKDLVESFYGIVGDILHDILSLLMNERLVLRSGVTTVRYVHQHYTDPWLIHSYKIQRLERESRVAFPEGSVYLLDGTNEKNDDAKVKKDDVKEKKEASSPKKLLNKRKRKLESANEESNEEDQVQKKVRKLKTPASQQKDVYKSVKMLDLHSAEKLKVVIKPWIRVDGVINQRVLHRMMGAVLAYCIKHPGVLLSKVQARFIPALQPFHTRELVEILVDLECLSTKALKTRKVTLFSKPSNVDLSFKPDLASNDELMIEPVIGASLKFGSFLSNKSYTLNFLSS